MWKVESIFFLLLFLTEIFKINGLMYSTTPVPGCWTTLTAETLTFSCSTGSTLRSFDTNIIFNRSSINTLQVTGHGGKGPLTSIPEDVCLFENLTVG